MRIFLFLLLLPLFILSQEFYPGSLLDVNNPICYETSIVLGFDILPSNTENNSYNYTWQKSWDGSNWFDIENSNNTSYVTEILFIDTHYRVNVHYQSVTISTNQITVYVLPPLSAGVLNQSCITTNDLFSGSCVDTLCIDDNAILSFEAEPSGGEWSWGGFLEFSYQWQQNNILVAQMVDGEITTINPENNSWINIGEDTETYLPTEPGFYFFRCMISSPYGCGTVFTNPIPVEIIACSNTYLTEYSLDRKLILTTNILGQQNKSGSFTFNIYNDGSIEKKYIIK